MAAEVVDVSRESVEEKARRYLAEGRVAVELADAATVHATARGSDAVYRVLAASPGERSPSPFRFVACWTSVPRQVGIRRGSC